MTDTTESAEKTLPDRLVLKGTLFRRQGRRVELTNTPPLQPEPRAPMRRPAKVARMLALAHHLQRLIDQGLVADRAALAKKLGLTRARVTQLLDLLLLGPDLQDRVLALEAMDGVEPVTERAVRSVAAHASWQAQRKASDSLLRRRMSVRVARLLEWPGPRRNEDNSRPQTLMRVGAVESGTSRPGF